MTTKTQKANKTSSSDVVGNNNNNKNSTVVNSSSSSSSNRPRGPDSVGEDEDLEDEGRLNGTEQRLQKEFGCEPF